MRHVFVEQRLLKLEWFSSITQLTLNFDPNALKHCKDILSIPKPNSLLVKSKVEDWFKNIWDQARKANSKLKFYNQVKIYFGFEPYLRLTNHKKVKHTTWLRTSSHRLNIETGRYGWKILSRHHRACDFCSVEADKTTLELSVNLPFVDLIIEDEIHFLRDCPKYDQLRDKRSMKLKNLLTHNIAALFDEEIVTETTNFFYKLFKMRSKKNDEIIK